MCNPLLLHTYNAYAMLGRPIIVEGLILCYGDIFPPFLLLSTRSASLLIGPAKSVSDVGT